LKEIPVAESVSGETVDRLRGAVTRITRVFDRQVTAGGLTRTQLSVLASVDTRGPIGLGELADIEGVNPTMLSRVVGKLEEAGLIQRQPDPDDRRAARVDVTAAGAKVRRKLLSERSQLLAERLTALPDDQIALLLAALPALEALSAQPAQALVSAPGARS
jgi:DNA-binding MarR family transcriptional regulator